MKNSAYSIKEASSLVAHLIPLSAEGKLLWRTGSPIALKSLFSGAEEGAFFATQSLGSYFAELPDDLTVELCNSPHALTFTLKGTDEQLQKRVELLAVSLEHEPKFGYDLPGESELYTQLSELYEYVRRSTLNIDQRLASVKSYLERIAG